MEKGGRLCFDMVKNRGIQNNILSFSAFLFRYFFWYHLNINWHFSYPDVKVEQVFKFFVLHWIINRIYMSTQDPWGSLNEKAF